VLLTDVPEANAETATLSPDGTFLAMSRVVPDLGRQVEIFSVVTGAPQWQSPVGVRPSGSWSWSPDSRWFFAATSDDDVLVVDMRAPWVRVQIPLSLDPGKGLAVTYR
jgi:hypothetical protein